LYSGEEEERDPPWLARAAGCTAPEQSSTSCANLETRFECAVADALEDGGVTPFGLGRLT
jgi:hypothetical protein